MVDGDTIKVLIDGRTFTVRCIGIDTPETVHPSLPVQWLGPEAVAANERLVAGQTVYLEIDVSETDRYQRLLRYVWIGDLMVNAEWVRLGYAQVGTYPPDVKHQSLFVDLQREALEADRGLWGEEPTPNTALCDYAMVYIRDVTIPDGTVIAPGDDFVKTWAVQNSGT